MTESTTKGVDDQSNSEAGTLGIEKLPDLGFYSFFQQNRKREKRIGLCVPCCDISLSDGRSLKNNLMNPEV